ncbi:MAG: hypothetical protein R6U32_01425 [Candidatus Woesearchaeota archaeon]
MIKKGFTLSVILVLLSVAVLSGCEQMEGESGCGGCCDGCCNEDEEDKQEAETEDSEPKPASTTAPSPDTASLPTQDDQDIPGDDDTSDDTSADNT